MLSDPGHNVFYYKFIKVKYSLIVMKSKATNNRVFLDVSDGTMEVLKPFELLVTHVVKFYGLVKVFGQTDLDTGAQHTEYQMNTVHLN